MSTSPIHSVHVFKKCMLVTFLKTYYYLSILGELTVVVFFFYNPVVNYGLRKVFFFICNSE